MAIAHVTPIKAMSHQDSVPLFEGEEEPRILRKIASCLKDYQWGGVRFMWENLVLEHDAAAQQGDTDAPLCLSFCLFLPPSLFPLPSLCSPAVFPLLLRLMELRLCLQRRTGRGRTSSAAAFSHTAWASGRQCRRSLSSRRSTLPAPPPTPSSWCLPTSSSTGQRHAPSPPPMIDVQEGRCLPSYSSLDLQPLPPPPSRPPSPPCERGPRGPLFALLLLRQAHRQPLPPPPPPPPSRPPLPLSLQEFEQWLGKAWLKVRCPFPRCPAASNLCLLCFRGADGLQRAICGPDGSFVCLLRPAAGAGGAEQEQGPQDC